MDISEFKRLNEKEGYARHPWELARVNVVWNLIRANIKEPQATLVDIGSGDAFVINWLAGKGLAKRYHAIDNAFTEEIVMRLAENNPDSKINFHSSIDAFIAREGGAGEGLYLCMDVLEHLKDENEILKYFPPDNENKGQKRYFVFTVPAFQQVFTNHDVLLGHYRRYNRKGFKKLLTNAGFEVVDSGYFFLTLLVLRTIEKVMLRKKDYSIDNWNGGALKTKLISAVLRADFWVGRLLGKVGIRIPGLSCYCICRN
ncbi:hypothetical protein [Parasegetibacter sp. NRK P23]|uniref:hypothetical protein n=1 Tax=Parasegetibacter sp. NRK P23 TaxID=2942999 RepID=UPI002042E24B|nr:hypothetical protein [Parasegetibacter sp. NRK P23]MCM5527517.1 hypothetical protein [Parasegetibacter sp. NRK P23]